MMQAKVGRPGKSNRICGACRQATLPKNGDWFANLKNDTQVFLCKSCERTVAHKYRRTVPARMSL